MLSNFMSIGVSAFVLNQAEAMKFVLLYFSRPNLKKEEVGPLGGKKVDYAISKYRTKK
jgi:hypothetical protein